MTAAEYRQAIDALPYGKRLPGAVYLIEPGEAPALPALLRITVAELRRRLDVGPIFNLLKFHTASPKISFLAYPDFEKDPHPALKEAVIVDLVTGKTRRDDYRSRAKDHPEHPKAALLSRRLQQLGLRPETIGHGPEKQAFEAELARLGLTRDLRKRSP